MSEPAWDHLPHDPQGFFGLAEGFDRKDLKRRYNEYLKQFKPEKFPAEFQKIRAAYEALDQRLRYGAEASLPTLDLPRYEWTASDALSSQAKSESSESTEGLNPQSIQRPAPKPWHERLRETSPVDLLAELQQIAEKQPFHYFAIGVIEDAFPDADPLAFLKAILKGLKRWPGDPGLSELLAAYLKDEVPVSQATLVLKSVAKIIRGDRYFYLTEGLWDRLLREGSFPEFLTTLQACEAQLIDHRNTARMAFYIHILKPALWLADDDWVDRIFDIINAEGEKLLWRFEFDLDFLQMLREYIQQRPDLVAGNPIRVAMDRTLRSYCIDDEPTFDRNFLSSAVQLGSQTHEVLAAFPLDVATDKYGSLYRLWLWLDREVAERHGIADDSADATQLVKSVRGMFRRIQERSDKTNVGSVWTVTGIIYLLLKVVTYILPVLLIGAVMRWLLPGVGLVYASNGAATLTLVVSIGGGFTAGWFLSKHVLLPNWYRFCRYWALVCYHQVWRMELVPFLRQTRLGYGEFLDVLSEAEHDDIHCSGWISHYSRIDYGLAFLGLAQRYIV